MQKAEQFKLPSGAELHVSMADFQSSDALMRSILKQLSGLKLSKEDMQRDIEELRENPSGIMVFFDKIISLVTSMEVRVAVFECAKSAKYAPNGGAGLVAINTQLFDDPEYGDKAREDYYTILYRIAEVNCKPFFAKTFSGLSMPKARNSSTPVLS